MREVILTKGYVALVDDEDYDRINRLSWYADVHSYTVYAVRTERRADGTNEFIRMHNSINPPPEGRTNDHWDRNGLNNTRNNLRVATQTQQNCNRIYPSKNPRGTYFDKRDGKWGAVIYLDKKKVSLGRFKDSGSAHEAYKEAARVHYGAFAPPEV